LERESLRIAEKEPIAGSGQDNIAGKDGDPIARLLPEFVRLMQQTLVSIRNMAQLSRGRFKDPGFDRYFQHSMAEETSKIESVLNQLIKFMTVCSPLLKSNTIHSLLDEALDDIKETLQRKSIRPMKEFFKDLPETVVHEEQLRFVFGSLLQYAASSAMEKGSIGIRTRSIAAKTDKASAPNGHIEVIIGFTGYQKTPGPNDFTGPDTSVVEMEKYLLNDPWRSTPPPRDTDPSRDFRPEASVPVSRDGILDLVLKLVREVVQKNGGKMTLIADEKKLRTYIVLTLPIERRKAFFFPREPGAPPPKSL
jgi:hypothetical protein